MKVFISADLEGVAGVVHEEHVMRDGREYDRARKLMTQEVNAAIEGAVEAGATEILVNDSQAQCGTLFPKNCMERLNLLRAHLSPYP
jgi:D-amino peptidase